MPKRTGFQSCQGILICFHMEKLVKLPVTILPSCHSKVSICCANSIFLVAKKFHQSLIKATAANVLESLLKSSMVGTIPGRKSKESEMDSEC